MEVGGKTIEFDDRGYMVDPSLWDEDVAKAIAKEEGIDDLTEAHWKIVHFIRKHWEKQDQAPPVGEICSEVGIGVRQVFKLFAAGPVRGAGRIAGLPKPPEGCV